jgi:uncharacterized protein YbjT (DUF2867 family)
MKILVTGAYGFIGSAVTARLSAEGHRIVGIGRSTKEAARKRPDIEWVKLDIGRAKSAEEWLPHLAGVEAVVNCAGVLQDGLGDNVKAVQADGTIALFAACERAGVRHVIHISAIGVDRAQPTEFTATKLLADEDLQKRDLDWVILRPSVVYGRGAYGGSALLRASAALPGFVPEFPDAGEIQLVHLDDVCETVAFFLKVGAPARVALDLAGPERLSLPLVTQRFRQWCGLSRARVIAVPRWLAALLFRAGDAASWLGWRPPVRTTAQRELTRGAVGGSGEWQKLTGIMPRSLDQALNAEPASIQEKWFARLYLLKPLMLGSLVLFWIVTGLLALGPGHGHAVGLMKEGGASELTAKLTVFAASILDLVIGSAMAFRISAHYALIASIAISLLYVVVGSVILPRLWADPLGPMTKMWPVIVFTIATLAILDDR